jgi:hypothetical protein
MYDNVEVSGSDLKKGAVAHAIMFAAYLFSLTILAILAVNVWVFLIIAVAGLPATGIFEIIEGHARQIRWEKEYAAQQESAVPIREERITDDNGLPVINL